MGAYAFSRTLSRAGQLFRLALCSGFCVASFFRFRSRAQIDMLYYIFDGIVSNSLGCGTDMIGNTLGSSFYLLSLFFRLSVVRTFGAGCGVD
jgi:hypothetical protein